jgi:hypothetical protein
MTNFFDPLINTAGYGPVCTGVALRPHIRPIPLSNALFTIYLQSLHFYLQSKSRSPKNIKLDLLNQFKSI